MARLTAGLLALAITSAAPAAAQGTGRWSAYIGEASLRFGVPAEWIRRVMALESGGRLTLGGRPITSRAGAMVLMQLMPGTWRDMRSVHGLGRDPRDPHDNIMAGAAYLRRLYARFGYPGLFAAYNAGPRRYADYLTGARRLPVETRAYMSALASPRGAAARGTGAQAAGTLIVRLPATSVESAAAAPAVGPPSLFVPLREARMPGR